ncbi:MAG: tryptophan--tRNA ligase [Candidatus Baldrarchaeia archaeon]
MAIVEAGEVKKTTDYERLIEYFGVERIEPILNRFKNPHRLIRRKVIFAHRDFDKILDIANLGGTFAVLSGRGPSNKLHIGHLLVYELNLYLQREYGASVYVPLSDDEKYVFRKVKNLEEAQYYALDNALDIVALGYDPKKTKFFISSEYPWVYKAAIRLSRHLTYSTVRAVFGFRDDNNPGEIFYSCIQMAHILFPEIVYGLPTVVPVAIDQDPYIRISRDVAAKLRLFKPAGLYLKYLRGLTGKPMSASEPQTCIFTTDDVEEARKKVWNAFTGGQPTIREQREKGGNPDICVVFEMFYVYFIEDDAEVERIRQDCMSGNLICGECKDRLCEYVSRFLKEHRRRREQMKDRLPEFFLHEIDTSILDKLP